MQGNGTFTILIVGAVLLFVIFRRARTLFTRQKIRPDWLALRLALFAVLGAVILIATLGDPVSLSGDLAGLLAGAAVAWLGLRLTVFERQPDGLYYTQNRYIGLAVFAIFLIRLLYRLGTGLGTAGTLARPASGGASAAVFAQFTSDPLTTAVYFLLIGYYVFYYTMLILRSRQAAASG